ncbi:MAG: ABC transporter ATP-binding protein [Actinobacteria bacterium]|nr:ABC transporter ATP-binding protein [Actinomycetota bacterium]
MRSDTPTQLTTGIELDSVDAGYGSTTVLRDVSLRVHRGTVGALLGPNGAGKSTTLAVMSGLVSPRAGRVVLGGEDVTTAAPHDRQRRGLCHVPEGRGIFPSLTTRENLILLAAGDPDDAIERAVAAFPSLGRRLDLPAGMMSGGERQMLAVARAYVSHPEVILLDEVSLGLAPIVVDDIYTFLHGLREQGVTMLLVEQFIARALGFADEVWVMRQGRIAHHGPAADLDAEAVADLYLG